MENGKTFLHYVEFTTKTKVKFSLVNFMEDINGEIYFLGMQNPLFYLPQLHSMDNSVAFSRPEMPELKKNKRKKIGRVSKICYG